MRPISQPLLPPKAGYVEVEKPDGTRTYRNAKTGILIEDEVPVPTLEEQLLTTQLALAELAETQEQDTLMTQLAIAELAEEIFGGEE